jgi:hypothetical protein
VWLVHGLVPSGPVNVDLGRVGNHCGICLRPLAVKLADLDRVVAAREYSSAADATDKGVIVLLEGEGGEVALGVAVLVDADVVSRYALVSFHFDYGIGDGPAVPGKSTATNMRIFIYIYILYMSKLKFIKL